jgi:mycothiol synthase
VSTAPQLLLVWPSTAVFPTVSLPEGYLLRAYLPGDEPGYYALMERAGWPGWDAARLAPWRPRMVPGSWLMGIERASGTIVASAMGLDDPTDLLPGGGELGWVATDPAHTRRGLARALCISVSARILAAQYPHVHLYTEHWRLPALQLYLGLGFRPLIDNPAVVPLWQDVYAQLGRTWPAEGGEPNHSSLPGDRTTTPNS